MATIKEYLTDDHRKCDEAFAQMEQAASSGSLADAKEAYNAFAADTERHFQMEERVMFPQFEEKTGMTMGPTQVMRHEHQQMRSILAQLETAIADENRDKFFGLTETMMIMMQQHNMKEEQMLYNMAQQHLAAESELIVDMMDSMVVE
jgi:hemerythrin-like domain-containing protein